MNLTNRKTIHIEWGDCDPAQIVHYPRYLAYFDACTTALFKKAGLSKRQMLKTYQIVGIPLVDVRASFKVPSRFSDMVIVESEITEWRRSSFCVRHRLFNKNVLGVECFEIRVWAVVSEADPERIESKPVPREVIEMFSAVKNRPPAVVFRLIRDPGERNNENAHTGWDCGRWARRAGACRICCTGRELIRSWSRLEAGSTASSGCEPASWSRAPSTF